MRILLVEDDTRIVAFVKRGLEAEGYMVDVAQDGQEGLALGMGNYALILLDLLLPVMSGLEVCKNLRNHQIHTPILMLTSKVGVQEKLDGFQLGADDYLTKPFVFEELLARIRALLRRTSYQEPPTELKVADVTLNRGTREVRRDGNLIKLTIKEFSLLEYLMSHPDRVLSRTLILEHVWGYQFDSLTNVVDVYIRYLRNKIDPGYSKKLIQTVRGIGYKISN